MFETSLVYRVSSKIDRDTEKVCLKEGKKILNVFRKFSGDLEGHPVRTAVPLQSCRAQEFSS